MTWHIYWLAIVGLIGIVINVIIQLSGNDEHDLITAAEVQKIEEARIRGRVTL